jgi:hypothetical protein
MPQDHTYPWRHTTDADFRFTSTFSFPTSAFERSGIEHLDELAAF